MRHKDEGHSESSDVAIFLNCIVFALIIIIIRHQLKHYMFCLCKSVTKYYIGINSDIQYVLLKIWYYFEKYQILIHFGLL